jgi:hypothetical protein
MKCAHCGKPLPANWQQLKMKKLHPECRAEYRKENCRKRALGWRNNNVERARRTGRQWYERNPEYQINRLHRMSLLAAAMEQLLKEAGISVDQFLEMENGSSTISRQSLGAPSPVVRS